MKIKDPKQRYTYFFRYRGQEDQPPVFVTTAYSVTQAVKQIAEKYPTKPIYNYFENEGFDITRKDFVPKEETPEPKKGYQQMDFKGFTDQNPWPNV